MGDFSLFKVQVANSYLFFVEVPLSTPASPSGARERAPPEGLVVGCLSDFQTSQGTNNLKKDNQRATSHELPATKLRANRRLHFFRKVM